MAMKLLNRRIEHEYNNNNNKGTVEEATSSFLAELGHRITALSGDSREISFLFQRVSVLVQRFNSVLLRESFTADSRPDDDL